MMDKYLADNGVPIVETSPSSPIRCGLAVAHPWLCDIMGHLSARYIFAMFDDAAYHLFNAIGYDPVPAKAEGWGWADVRQELEYRAGIAAGATLRIDGKITAMGKSSLSAAYELCDTSSGQICATLIAKTVCLDLVAHKARPLPDAIATRCRTTFGVV